MSSWWTLWLAELEPQFHRRDLHVDLDCFPLILTTKSPIVTCVCNFPSSLIWWSPNHCLHEQTEDFGREAQSGQPGANRVKYVRIAPTGRSSKEWGQQSRNMQSRASTFNSIESCLHVHVFYCPLSQALIRIPYYSINLSDVHKLCWPTQRSIARCRN